MANELSRLALAEELAPVSEVARVWQAVHRDPQFIYAALRDRALMATPVLEDQFHAMSERWDVIRAADQMCERLSHDARTSGEHFIQAQHGHVNWLSRAIVIATVTLAIGYLSMSVFEPLVGSGRALWIALSGALGAMIAAMFSYDRERAAGRRAHEAFENRLEQIDRTLIDRHEACQAAVEQADIFGQQTRAAGAGRRLRRLLDRARSILDHEIGPVFVGREQTVANQNPLLPVEDPGDFAMAAGNRQRRRYVQATRLRHPVAPGYWDQVRRAEDNETFIREQVQAFQRDVWQVFCPRHDRARAGCLPARYLVPVLRRFRDGFQKHSAAKVRELMVRRFESSDLTGLGNRAARRVGVAVVL